MRRPSQSGFSLIELAVTLTVMVLLVTAAFPSVADWLRNTRVRNAAASMQSGLMRARSEALRTNQMVTFWLVQGSTETAVDNFCALSSASGSWVVSLNDPSGACAAAPSPASAPMITETHAAGDGGAGVTVAAQTATGDTAQCVRFNGFGRVVDSSTGTADACRQPLQIAKIDVTHAAGGARALRIVVSAGGSVRTCDVNVTASTDPRKCP
jgi:type IV fimbrial biogenesis protein FimT